MAVAVDGPDPGVDVQLAGGLMLPPLVTAPEILHCGECLGDGELEVWDDECARPGWVDCEACGGSGYAVPAIAGRVVVWGRRVARVVRFLSWFTGWGPPRSGR